MLPVLFVENARFASGFYVLALLNAAIYTLIFALVLVKHQRENRVRGFGSFYKPVAALCAVALVVLPLAGAYKNGLRGVDALMFGLPYFSLTQRTFPVAGAGQGGAGVWTIKFKPHWHNQSISGSGNTY